MDISGTLLLSPLSGFQPPSSVEFREPGFDVLRGPAFCSLRYSPSPVENLRRMGHHCHGRKRLSGGNRKSFCLLLGKKFCGMCISPWTGGDGCGCLCPRRQGLKQVMAPDTTTGRDPPQRREARFGNGVAPYIPAAFCRDVRRAGTARQRRRDRNGRCKPGVFTHGP